jgi:hypothetical protein
MALPKNGVAEAPKIVPSAFGLLAVVNPENSADEDRWVRGFSQEWETTVNNLTNWDDTDTSDYALVNGATVNYYDEIKPFFIEIDETRSTLGFLGLDRTERQKRQLEGVTQKALERELWNGDIRVAESHDNKALIDGATVLNSGTALSAKRALALLEHTIATTSHAGEQGIIHMTRDVVALLSSNSNMLFHEKDKDHLQTMGGTPVIVGSGYSGQGPVSVTDGSEDPSATNKWIYATGTVRVYLGDVDVVNDNLAQGYDVAGNQNDMRLKAIRPAAVYFDTSIHLAVRVDLTAA